MIGGLVFMIELTSVYRETIDIVHFERNFGKVSSEIGFDPFVDAKLIEMLMVSIWAQKVNRGQYRGSLRALEHG